MPKNVIGNSPLMAFKNPMSACVPLN